ncbi:hypothetical protein, partial [Paenibacillus alginolyticus]|uniref:hypothetical protein n=1 Tax=Paenibacillus alginolyticus TaxID=59839 RepID=UPI002DBA87F6
LFLFLILYHINALMWYNAILFRQSEKLQQLLPKSRHSPFGPNTGNFATNGFEMAGDFKKTRK